MVVLLRSTIAPMDAFRKSLIPRFSISIMMAMCVCMCVCIHVCVYTCVYVHAYKSIIYNYAQI